MGEASTPAFDFSSITLLTWRSALTLPIWNEILHPTTEAEVDELLVAGVKVSITAPFSQVSVGLLAVPGVQTVQ